LVKDLCIPVKIFESHTVRETDGLAMSSRNSYLTTDERNIAPVLFQVLDAIATEVKNDNRNFSQLEKGAFDMLKQAGFMPEYLAIRDAESLEMPGQGSLVILAAARLGKARLIDNIIIRR